VEEIVPWMGYFILLGLLGGVWIGLKGISGNDY
jgi:hypothetical protein